MPRQNNRNERNRTYAEAYGGASRPFLEITPPEYTPEQISTMERERLESEFYYDMEAENDRLALEREMAPRPAPPVVPALATAEIRPRTPGQLILNKTQLRELMAHSRVWEYVPAPLRNRIVNSVASDGVLFQLTNSQRTELRNALAHGRSHRSISPRLQAIFNQSHRWS